MLLFKCYLQWYNLVFTALTHIEWTLCPKPILHVRQPHWVILTSLSMSVNMGHIRPYMFGHIRSNIPVTHIKGIYRRPDVWECLFGSRLRSLRSSNESSTSLPMTLSISRSDSKSSMSHNWTRRVIDSLFAPSTYKSYDSHQMGKNTNYTNIKYSTNINNKKRKKKVIKRKLK